MKCNRNKNRFKWRLCPVYHKQVYLEPM